MVVYQESLTASDIAQSVRTRWTRGSGATARSAVG